MAAIDAERIEAGLRAHGLLYGSAGELRDIVAKAPDAAAAVRAYLEHRRPQLLALYDVESMIAMVLAAADGEQGDAAMFEQFHPR